MFSHYVHGLWRSCYNNTTKNKRINCWATFFFWETYNIWLCFLRRYEQRVQKTQDYLKGLGIDMLSAKSMSALDKWEIPRDRIVLNRKLGEGAFGTVYGGECFFDEKGWVCYPTHFSSLASVPKTIGYYSLPGKFMPTMYNIITERMIYFLFNENKCSKKKAGFKKNVGIFVKLCEEWMWFGLECWKLSKSSFSAKKERTIVANGPFFLTIVDLKFCDFR